MVEAGKGKAESEIGRDWVSSAARVVFLSRWPAVESARAALLFIIT